MRDSNVNLNKGYSDYPIAEVTAIPVPCPSTPVTTEEKPNHPTNYAREYLKGQGYTDGLIQSIARSNDDFPFRIWVVDNSGSMTTGDGHRLHQTSDHHIRLLNCSRWAEIQDTVEYHAQTAAALEAPTTFWLLNPAGGLRGGKQQFGIAEQGTDHIQEDLRIVLNNIRGLSPSGGTPLAKRVREIAAHVASLANQLNAKGQKAVIVLATDGLPTGGKVDFQHALRSLEGLPVWVVIRLCTDDDEVVDFYNDIDNDLELSIDVLDDFFAEAKEVYEHNPWLNYALPLHRMRENGFYHKLFDLIDERPLTADELRDFFLLLYGADTLDGLPDPQIDWPRFMDRIAVVTHAEKPHYNPIKNKMRPWVDIRKLDSKYGIHNTCSCSVFKI